MEQHDQYQRGKEGQHEGPVEPPRQGHFGVVVLALVNLAFQRQRANPQHVRGDIALPQGGKCKWRWAIPGSVESVIGGVAGVTVKQRMTCDGGEIFSLLRLDPLDHGILAGNLGQTGQNAGSRQRQHQQQRRQSYPLAQENPQLMPPERNHSWSPSRRAARRSSSAAASSQTSRIAAPGVAERSFSARLAG